MNTHRKQQAPGLAGFLCSGSFVALSLAVLSGIVMLDKAFPGPRVLGFTWFDLATVWFCACVMAALAGSWVERARGKAASDADAGRLKRIADGEPLRITEATSSDNLGELRAEHVKWLADHHTRVGLEANGFFFLPELLDMLIEQESPPAPLVEFLRKAMAGRESMELRWEQDQAKRQ